MKLTLRPYQTQQIDDTRAALARHRRVIMQGPTGCGKTATATAMVAAKPELPTLFIVHRQELVKQTTLAFRRERLDFGIVAPRFDARLDLPLHIGMVQSVGRRLDKMPEPRFIVIDECHRSVSASYSRIIERWPQAYVVGLTATPHRLDGKGLGEHYGEIVDGPSVRSLIRQGYLSEFRCYSTPEPDVSAVRKQFGDFHQGALAAAVDTPAIVGDIVEHWKRLALGKKTIVFAVNVKHSESLAKAFNAAGVPAAHIDGNTPDAEREALLLRFALGEIQVVCNVELFGEGFDLAANAGMECTVECVVMARHTMSLAMAIQHMGRQSRPKADGGLGIILDHVGNIRRHGFPDDEREWSLEGRSAVKSGSDGECSIRQCPGPCYAIYPAVRMTCPECGAEAPVLVRDPKKVAGQLVELERQRVKAEKARTVMTRRRETRGARTFEELKALGESRGYEYPAEWAERQLEIREAYAEKRAGKAGRGNR